MVLAVRDVLHGKIPEGEVLLQGWIRTRRDSRDVSFLALNDGTSLASLQLVCDASTEVRPSLQQVTTGCSVRAFGILRESPGAGQDYEMALSRLEVIGEAPADTYPLQKKRHSFEFLRQISHLRGRTNTFGAMFRLRSRVSHAIHRFFEERDFNYIHTPIITASDCEGAGEMFTVTALSPEAMENDASFEKDFFGTRTGLTVSGQLEAELLATALGKVYTFGPTFRAENSNTSRHLAEFWMVEPEVAFATLEDDAVLAEAFLKEVTKDVIHKSEEDMNFFSTMIEKGKIENLQAMIAAPFTRMNYTDAVKELLAAPADFEYTPEWGHDLQSEHERYLTSQVCGGPVIVTDYPASIKPFYMLMNDDEKTVRAMDVLLPEIGEVIGGSEREYRLDVLMARMEEAGLGLDEYQWYLDTRRYGTVPHAGFGMGLERYLQYITGMKNIRDVIPFPRTPGGIVV